MLLTDNIKGMSALRAKVFLRIQFGAEIEIELIEFGLFLGDVKIYMRNFVFMVFRWSHCSERCLPVLFQTYVRYYT